MRLLFLIISASIFSALALASEPLSQSEKPSWQKTLITQREGLARQSPSNRKSFGYASPVLRGGQPAIRVSIAVQGLDELFLYVTGVPDPVAGAATWAEAKLIDADGKEVPVSGLSGLQVLEGRYSIDVNLKSGVSGPLTIAGRRFQHGLHVCADSRVRLPLGGKYRRLEAWIGIDDWVGQRGAVRFDVVDATGAAKLDLWSRVLAEFPEGPARREIRWEREDRILDEDWTPGDYRELAGRYAKAARRVPPLAGEAERLSESVRNREGLNEVRKVYLRSRELHEALSCSETLNCRGLRLAIEDLQQSNPGKYSRGDEFLARLQRLEAQLNQVRARQQNETGNERQAASLAELEQIADLVRQFEQLQRESLLANPLLDFERMLVVRRKPDCDARTPMDTGYGMGEYLGLPRQSSKCNPGIEKPIGWDNEIAVLESLGPDGRLTTLYRPDDQRLITDVDLHWDGKRMLFAMPDRQKNWQVFEVRSDGTGLRQLTPGDHPDVHHYDPCYLPNGRIAFISTAPLQGVPCNAGVIVGMMYLMDADGRNIQQVCFEQDHDYCPTVLNDGRVLYLRWDYTDTPHVWNRVLFAMNPDGTNQMEYYGSNSYWPNSIFYARPVPNHPTKVAGIVTGHHVGRVGELVIFDPAKGRREADGVVQRIPGYGQKVEPIIEDKLTEHSWPKFLHPWPLSDKHFLVSCKPTPDALWGIYLVDTFDNMVLIKELEGQALLEPIPLKRSPVPPVIPDKTQPGREDAQIYMADVYQGSAMQGIPRGTIKSLRVFSYHFGYQKIAGIDHRVGTDGPWEVKRILGTVPVEADGSALFRAPAKTPLSVQPLDAEGRAVQLMRSWMTAQPGETLSCVGCHEPRNNTPPSRATIAAARRPSEIHPWYGPPRNFSFRAEVQPVLDRHCVGCHNGQPHEGRQIVDLRGEQNAFVVFRGDNPAPTIVRDTPREKLVGKFGGIFEPSYFTLRSLVRPAGLEADLHQLPPTEFFADASELLQMLKKGHYGVQLDREAWDRLYTWIDLNAPSHGTWSEFVRITGDQQKRRCELAGLYGGLAEDREEPLEFTRAPIEPIVPKPISRPKPAEIRLRDFPFDAEEAGRRQQSEGPYRRTVDLGGVKLDLLRIPAGTFVMGDADGSPDEQPLCEVQIDRPFWMATCEITNRQYAMFDPSHESRYEHRGSWIFSEEYLGHPLDGPQQPVVRVSWNRAMEFCRWLSERTGMEFTLPTESQWEYACRTGSDTPFSFGPREADFSSFANLADATIRELAYRSWRPRTPDIVPRDSRFSDRSLVSADVGSYQSNAWGLFDMHGNVSEWTRSRYQPYPYRNADGRNHTAGNELRVVRGGSWRDRPARAGSAFRLGYAPYQRAFNVGFRVVCESP